MNHETSRIPDGEREHESNRQTEIGRLLDDLGREAERVGIQLAETDFINIGPDERMRLFGRIEIILSALAVAIGAIAAYDASQTLFQPEPAQLNVVRLATRLGVAAVGAGGAALVFAGLRRLEIGYKRLQGFIRMKELKDLDG